MGKAKFQLRRLLPGSVTFVVLNAAQGGGILILNRGSAVIKSDNPDLNGLKPATQKELQTVYNNGPEFHAMIAPPPGYVPPWSDAIEQPAGDASATEEE